MSAPSPSSARAAGPSQERPRGLPLGRILLGLLLVLGGIGWLLERLDVWSPRWGLVAPVALIVVGIACVIAAWDRADRGGLITVGVLLSLVVIATAVLPGPLGRMPIGAGVGDRVQRPASAGEVEPRYELGMGTLEIDLRDVEATDRLAVAAHLGVGTVLIRVPEDVPVSVTADVGIGEATLLRQERSGLGISHKVASEDFQGAERRFDLTVEVGIGSVEVSR